MKILLVDDESRKIKSLVKSLTDIKGVEKENIIYVLDIISAKEKMTKEFYDLVVLDLKISETIEDDLYDYEGNDHGTAGLDFIEEILNTDSIKTPQEIIILTEHEELLEQCHAKGRDLQFQILKYDEQSEEWRDRIKYRVEFLQKHNESLERFSYSFKVDFAIICAVDEEFQGIKKAFKNYLFTNKRFEDDPNNYYISSGYSFKRQKNISIVISQQRQMGMVAATSLSQSIISHFAPEYLIMPGIAAGIQDDLEYGYIMVATEVWDYSSGKYKRDLHQKHTSFRPDSTHIPLDATVESIIRNVKKEEGDIISKIHEGWKGKKPDNLKIKFGPISCGTSVVGDTELVNTRILNHARKTIGLDMESYGVFYAATYGISNKTIPICIKSVSDFANVEKKDDYQPYAAYTSSEFTKYLIEHIL